MKSLTRGIIVLSALATPLMLSAQTAPTPAIPQPVQAAPMLPSADDIVAKYVAAVGGKDAISQVKSLSMEASISIMGTDAPSTTTILDGVGYKTEMDFNGSKIIQCYTDKGGWQINPMTGSPDPTPMADDEYNQGKAQLHIAGELFDYAARGSKVEVLGKDPGVYKLKLTSKDKVETVFLIDDSTYLIKSAMRKGKMQGQDVDISTTFSDYRKTDLGYVLPYAIAIDLGGQFSLNIAVKKIDLNKTIPPSTFDMPKAAPATPSA